MRTGTYNSLKTIFITILILTVSSCSKGDDLSNLENTFFLRHKNADMPVYIHGNGTKKVFLITLHGGPGDQGLGVKGDAFDIIEEKYAVVYFDQRGSAASQGSYSENDVTVALMAQDVIALVEMLKHKYGSDARFFLLGHSWGGTLAAATVLEDQSDFLGWINVDGPLDWTSWYAKYRIDFDQVANEQIALGNSADYWESIKELVDDVDATYNQKDFFRLNNKSFQAERRLISDNIINRRSGSEDYLFNYNFLTFFWNRIKIQSILVDEQGILKNLSFTEKLSEIQIPSLLLWGRHDITVPPSFAEETFDNLGTSEKELIYFEKSGHAPMSSESTLFAEKVIEFMNQNK